MGATRFDDVSCVDGGKLGFKKKMGKEMEVNKCKRLMKKTEFMKGGQRR